MVFKEVLLIAVESASENSRVTLDTHTFQGRPVCYRRYEHLTTVTERDETPIEQMIN